MKKRQALKIIKNIEKDITRNYKPKTEDKAAKKAGVVIIYPEKLFNYMMKVKHLL